MCKYCENKEQGYTNIVEKNKDTFMRIVFNYPGKVTEGKIYTRKIASEGPDVTYIIFRNKIGSLAAEIHYCPFCGEELLYLRSVNNGYECNI